MSAGGAAVPGTCRLCHERYGKGLHFCNGGDSCPCAVAKLREALATVTAERDDRGTDLVELELLWQAERAAHAETHKALELQTELKVIALRGEQTARAELAKAEARAKELERMLSEANQEVELKQACIAGMARDADDMQKQVDDLSRALGDLRG